MGVHEPAKHWLRAEDQTGRGFKKKKKKESEIFSIQSNVLDMRAVNTQIQRKSNCISEKTFDICLKMMSWWRFFLASRWGFDGGFLCSNSSSSYFPGLPLALAAMLDKVDRLMDSGGETIFSPFTVCLSLSVDRLSLSLWTVCGPGVVFSGRIRGSFNWSLQAGN